MKVIIETNRLLLREWHIHDAQEMFLLNADHDVVKYTGDSHFKNIGEAEWLISNYDQYKKYGFGRWTVLLKATNEYLGWCGLKYNEDIKEVDIGFRLHKKHWGRGYATEAAEACLKFGFVNWEVPAELFTVFGENLKLKRIIGRVLKVNNASINVLEKIGMSFVKEELLHGWEGLIYSIENPFISGR